MSTNPNQLPPQEMYTLLRHEALFDMQASGTDDFYQLFAGNIQPGVRRLGVDIGKVIVRDDTDDPSKTIFEDKFLEAPEVSGAVEAIRVEHDSGKWDGIYLVSKCGPKIQERTRLWLEHNDFYERSGVNPNDVYFCLERFEKGIIAAQLGLTHFIDDRQDVLQMMPKSVERILLNYNPKIKKIGGMAVANSWIEITDLLSH